MLKARNTQRVPSVAIGLGALSVVLAGCAATPMGPTAQVMPGPGKSFEAFQFDQASCKTYAASQVQGQADAANKSAVGAAVLSTVLGAGLGAAVGGASGAAGAGAAIGAGSGAGLGAAIGGNSNANAQAGIQQQYDNAFSQCMYAKGEQVQGFAPVASAAPVAYGYVAEADPTVRAVQHELIRLGYLHGGADGIMGRNTANAISQYEQASGLPVDGAPSHDLLARLQSTPGNQAVAAQPANSWVTPASAAAPATPAASGWVKPANAADAGTSTTAQSGGWVKPATP